MWISPWIKKKHAAFQTLLKDAWHYKSYIFIRGLVELWCSCCSDYHYPLKQYRDFIYKANRNLSTKTYTHPLFLCDLSVSSKFFLSKANETGCEQVQSPTGKKEMKEGFWSLWEITCHMQTHHVHPLLMIICLCGGMMMSVLRVILYKFM